MDRQTMNAIMRLYGDSQEARTQDYLNYMNPNDREELAYRYYNNFYELPTNYQQQILNDDKRMGEYANRILGDNRLGYFIDFNNLFNTTPQSTTTGTQV